MALLLAPLKGQSEDLAYRDLPDQMPARYGVIGLRPKALGADSLAIDKISLYGPAHRAGLHPGDRILAIPPYRIRTAAELSRCVQSHAPGDTLQLVVRRGEEVLALSCGVTDVRQLYYLMDEQIPKTAAGPTHPVPARPPTQSEAAALDLIRQQAATPDLESLRRALAFDANRYGRACRLQAVDMALHHPLMSARIAQTLSDDFAAATLPTTYLEMAARHLDLALPDATPSDPIDAPAPIAFLYGPLAAAAQQTDRAFAALDGGERQTLLDAVPDLLARFGDTLLLDEGDSTETAGHIRTLRLAKKVDLAALFLAAHSLARLADPDTLQRLRTQLQNLKASTSDSLPPGSSGDFLYAAPSPLGWIIVGDEGPNFYGTDALAIFDLGGDDIYFHSHPVALIVDYGGDDRYLGSSIASGLGGVSMLVDWQGDDLYQSGDFALGTAFCGIGLLWDRQGDDRYLNAQVGQGAAFFGAGLLIDDRGDDLYSAALFAQGFGGMRGLGLLADRAGDDHYLADGKVPSSYGTPDTYAGWSQGVGCGFRGYGSGGIGLLLDGEGNDYYQGGDFAQGIGYFFGLGLLEDRRGDDRYQGSRYAQGAAAHQAVGVLLEAGGNDRYTAKIAASQGAGWDAAIGYLSDLAGDDRYEGLHLAQGAAAMNGLGLLFDGDGRDRYEARTGQGQGSSTTYWGGRDAPNIGLLIDLGGDEDTYSLRANKTDVRTEGVGLFSDR